MQRWIDSNFIYNLRTHTKLLIYFIILKPHGLLRFEIQTIQLISKNTLICTKVCLLPIQLMIEENDLEVKVLDDNVPLCLHFFQHILIITSVV